MQTHYTRYLFMKMKWFQYNNINHVHFLRFKIPHFPTFQYAMYTFSYYLAHEPNNLKLYSHIQTKVYLHLKSNVEHLNSKVLLISLPNFRTFSSESNTFHCNLPGSSKWQFKEFLMIEGNYHHLKVKYISVPNNHLFQTT